LLAFTAQRANEFPPDVREIVRGVIAIKKEVDSKTDGDSMSGTIERLGKETCQERGVL